VSCENRNCLAFTSTCFLGGILFFLVGVSVAHRFSLLCCDFCFFFLFLVSNLYLMLSVSLDSTFTVLVFCVVTSVLFVFILCLMPNVVCVSGFYLRFSWRFIFVIWLLQWPTTEFEFKLLGYKNKWKVRNKWPPRPILFNGCKLLYRFIKKTQGKTKTTTVQTTNNID